MPQVAPDGFARPGGAGQQNVPAVQTGRFKPSKLNVNTIHAEVEGILMANDFRQLLAQAGQRGIDFHPLGDLLPADPTTLPQQQLVRGALPGREGWLGVQQA